MNSPASLVASARATAGMSRRALAERADVTPSTITRIEDGEMDPTYTMLARVLGAAGRELHATATELTTTSVARLVDAYQPGKSGPRFDWTRLRGFVDWLRRHPEHVESAISTPPARTHTALDVLLAGIAEKLADDAGVPRPRWTTSVPGLTAPWEPPGTPRMVERARREAPEPLRRRNMFLAERDLWRPRA